MAERVWTIQELLTWTTDFFRTRGMETPRLDAEVLLAAVLDGELDEILAGLITADQAERLKQVN